MAATKSAGRVSIRVVPDSTRFKEDLKTSLERIERTTVVKIPAELELDRQQLLRIKRQIEALRITIRPRIELNADPIDMGLLEAEIEDSVQPVIDVGLNTFEASRRIEALTRTRTMRIRIVETGLTAVRNKIMALAGFNVLGDTFKEGSQFLQNLDRNAVKYAQMSTKIAAMVSGIGSVLGGLVTVASDLAALGGIGILAPAFLTGMGVGIGVLVAALGDMGDVLADLKPKFASWQDSISADFWKEAAGPIRELSNYLLPLLNTTDGTTNTARSLGQFVGEIAKSIKEILTADKLNLMLDRMNNSIDILKGAIRPLTNSFVNLGIVGSGYFERFSNWIVKLSNQFDAFIERTAADGSLDRWIENAIQGFKDVGSIIWSVIGMFKALDTAASRAGTISLHGLADVFNQIEATMKSDRFQAGLESFFRGVNTAFKGIVDGFIGLGPSIESFMPTFEKSMGIFGDIFRKVFEIVGKFLSNEKFQNGLVKFFEGISKALDELMPAIDPLAASLGQVFELMGIALPNAAKLISTMAQTLGPVFDKMLEKLKPLIEPLTNFAITLMEKLAPVLDKFVEKVLPPLIDLLILLMPHIVRMVELLTPVLAETIEYVATGLTNMGKAIKDFNEWAKPFLDWLDKVIPLLTQFKMPKIELPGMEGLAANLAVNFGIALGLNSPLARVFGKFLGDNLMEMSKNLKTFTDGVAALFLPNGPQNIAKNFGLFLGGDSVLAVVFKTFLMKNLTTMITNIQNFFTEVAKLFSPEGMRTLAVEIAINLKRFFDGLGPAIALLIAKWWRDRKKDFQDGFRGLFGFGTSTYDDDPAKIIDGGGLGTPAKGRSAGAAIMPALINKEAELGWVDQLKLDMAIKFAELFGGVTTQAQTGNSGIALDFATKYAAMGVTVDTFKTNALVSWGIWGAGMVSKAQESMGGADTTVTEKATNMGVTIGAWVAENGPKWAAAFEFMKGQTVEKMGGADSSTTTNMASIAATVATKLQEIKNNWGPAWEGVRAGLQLAWDQMTGNTRTGVDNNANEAGKLPDKAKNAIGDTRFTLLSSGAALVKGFADGMNNNLSLVQSAAIAVAAEVAKHMPHSPAKEGPLSGLGYTTHSGRALVRDFAGGMMDNMRLVRDASEKLATAASPSSLDLETNLDENGITIDRREVNLVVNHPVAEPTSRTIEKASNTLKMAGAF